MFDLQIEAEALGCELVWANNNPPAVVSHPLISEKNLNNLTIPGPSDGRIGEVMKACRQSSKNHPDIALYGLVTGPFTLALHLLGTDIFIKMDFVLHLVLLFLPFIITSIQPKAKFLLPICYPVRVDYLLFLE
ncbi:hypothetical protein ES708_25465 [subsurface metagenome]